jgi:hypothetical protein
MRFLALAIPLLLTLACAPAAPPPAERPSAEQPQEPAPNPTAVIGVATSTPALTAPPDKASAKPTACGALGCLLFDKPEHAFAKVLETKPLVVAVGEAHALKGTEGIATATTRFRDQLLPLMRGDASDLVIELMLTDGKCRKTEKKIAQVQKPVTNKQSGSNQNEFVKLGDKSKSLAIRPHVLRPKCEDYQAVLAAGPDGIIQMLTMIGELSAELLIRILRRNKQGGADKMVLAYGGAMHNDLAPAQGREAWSFGPKLQAETGGRYVEIDLIVPEFIKDSASWRKLPWYEHFDRDKNPGKVTLFNPAPGSYVLIFAATKR